MTDEEFRDRLAAEGYQATVKVGKTWFGVLPYMFTYGLCYGLTADGLAGRFCYSTQNDAMLALMLCVERNYPPGALAPPDLNFIKHKGLGPEYTGAQLQWLSTRAPDHLLFNRCFLTDWCQETVKSLHRISDAYLAGEPARGKWEASHAPI